MCMEIYAYLLFKKEIGKIPKCSKQSKYIYLYVDNLIFFTSIQQKAPFLLEM